MISFPLGKPSSGPRMTTTLAANSRLSRGYSAPAPAWLYCRMHGGTIRVRTHLRGPRTSLCLLDDPVTFAINEDHAPKIPRGATCELSAVALRPANEDAVGVSRPRPRRFAMIVMKGSFGSKMSHATHFVGTADLPP